MTCAAECAVARPVDDVPDYHAGPGIPVPGPCCQALANIRLAIQTLELLIPALQKAGHGFRSLQTDLDPQTSTRAGESV